MTTPLDTVLIDTPYAKLTKGDLLNYYGNKSVQQKMLKDIRDRAVVIQSVYNPNEVVLRRKDPRGEGYKVNTPSDIQALAEKRMAEIHPEFGKKVDFILADIDPREGVKWDRVRATADTVAKAMKSHPDVKDVQVRFSGGRGFYVQGKLHDEVPIDRARALSKKILSNMIGNASQRWDLTLGIPKANQIRLDTSTFHNRGSIRAPYSINAQTGLVSAPVKLEDLPKVQKEDFTVDKILGRMRKKRAQYENILEGIETPNLRTQMVDVLTQYAKSPDPAHDIQHIQEVINVARQIYPNTNVNREQLFTAAILHDIGRAAEFQGGAPHEIAGAALARPYLHTFSPGVQRNIIHAIRQHRGGGTPRTMLAKLVHDADKLPHATDPAVAMRRLAQYGLAKGINPKLIPEDARQYLRNNKLNVTQFLTPGAQAYAQSHVDKLQKLVQDPVAFRTAMEPYLQKSSANAIPAAAMYHGSPKKLEQVEPKKQHGDPKVTSAIFGSPSREFALSYSGKKWGDRDIEQSTKWQNGKQKITLREMRPGALNEVYKRPGYLYQLPAEEFDAMPRGRATWEQVSTKTLTPTVTELIPNVLEALRSASNVELLPYDVAAVRKVMTAPRRVKRLQELPPGGRADYLKWYAETLPSELAPDLEKLRKKVGAAEFAPGIPIKRNIKKIPSVTDQPWTLAVQFHKALKAGPHATDPAVAMRRLAQYGLAKGINPKLIPEDARQYLRNNKLNVTQFLTPGAQAYAQSHVDKLQKLVQDPVAFRTAMEPYLQKSSAKEQVNIARHRALVKNLKQLFRQAEVPVANATIGGSGIIGAHGLKEIHDLDVWAEPHVFTAIKKLPDARLETAASGSPVVRFNTPHGEIEVFTGPWQVGKEDFSGLGNSQTIRGVKHWSPERTL